MSLDMKSSAAPAYKLLLTASHLRKPAKRIRSHLYSAHMRLRNLVVARPVLGSTPVVVSLTSYGSRINAAAIAIESIARGRSKPMRMILWLDNPSAYADRPRALRRLERRGLEVRLTENFGPHTKYFPYVDSVKQHEFPLVTADDDIIYPAGWLQSLHQAYRAHPDSINCHWASEVKTEAGQLAGYLKWPNCRNTDASFRHFGLGVSGVIYPPRMLQELASRGNRFQELSPTADDVWLHWVALNSGIQVRQISAVPRHFPLIPGTQTLTLMETNNIEGSGNDTWIRGLYSLQDVQVLSADAAHMTGGTVSIAAGTLHPRFRRLHRSTQ